MAELFDILTSDTATGTATDVGETWESLLTLSTPSREIGKYRASVVFITAFPDALRSTEWRLTGDVTTPTYLHEQSDATNYEPFEFSTEVDHAGGVFEFSFESQKETGGAQLDFDNIHLTFRRVG